MFTANDGAVHWDSWRGQAGWLNESDRTINWAEEAGLELAVLAAVELGLSGRRVVIWGDNNIAIGALHNGATSNILMNESIIRTLIVQAAQSIVAEPLYAATEENIADGASRGVPGAGHRRYRFNFSLPSPPPPCGIYFPSVILIYTGKNSYNISWHPALDSPSGTLIWVAGHRTFEPQ